VQHTSFQAVAIALGLFPEDGEAHFAMAEAINASYSPGQLRFLFASILVDIPTDAPKLYNDFLSDISWDLQINLQEPKWQNTLLQILQGYLRSRGTSLSEFQLPMPYSVASELSTEVAAFQPYSTKMTSTEMTNTVANMVASFNPEQPAVYQRLRAAVEQLDNACLYFLDGKAGRGKTFVMNCLVASFRAQGGIALVVGSTALSIVHYEHSRTAHSTFGIPIVEVGR
jgi:primosomal protein N'